MATYKSIIAYDGTEFQGFQRQADEHRTVQGEFERGLKRIGWMEGSLKAAGRTDAGVHARGQVVAYSLNWRSEVEDLTRALNANLPPDIAVSNTETVPADFHPRYAARSRKYTYVLIACENRDPLRERYSWRLWPAPSFDEMAKVADLLVGQHDFAPFGQAPTEGGHTNREVFAAEWSRKSDQFVFSIEANAFLYHMVRRLVAAMVSVGHRKRRMAEFSELLQDPSKRWEGGIAPPNGLFLEGIIYKVEIAGEM
jgi:tRNA pseudouridine38-40 synthase